MRVSVSGHIPTTGDCGHKFDVPIAGLEDEFECPVCGAKDRYSEQQIASIKQQIGSAAGSFGAKKIAEALGDHIAKRTRGFKHVKYRKK